MTLRELIAEHPEWADLPIVVAETDGTVDYVGAAGDVYAADVGEGGEDVLVFTGN